MIKNVKRAAREGGITQILIEQYKLSKRSAFDFIGTGKSAGYLEVIDNDSLNNHDRAKILMESLSETFDDLDLSDSKAIVTCYKCFQRLRVPTGKKIVVTCSKCKHRFEVNW